MSIKGIKGLVARLHSDDEARNRFAADADAMMSEYKLTGPEKKAVKTAHLRVGPNGTLSLEQTALDWWLA